MAHPSHGDARPGVVEDKDQGGDDEDIASRASKKGAKKEKKSKREKKSKKEKRSRAGSDASDSSRRLERTDSLGKRLMNELKHQVIDVKDAVTDTARMMRPDSGRRRHESPSPRTASAEPSATQPSPPPTSSPSPSSRTRRDSLSGLAPPASAPPPLASPAPLPALVSSPYGLARSSSGSAIRRTDGPATKRDDESSSGGSRRGSNIERSLPLTGGLSTVSVPRFDSARIYDYECKIVLCGTSGVGKTSLRTRLCEKKFEENYMATLGVEFHHYAYTTGEEKRSIKVAVWDTAGQEKFKAITPNYYRGAYAVVAVYDVTDAATYDAITEDGGYIADAQRYCGSATAEKQPLIMVIGNKIDRSKREVPRSDAESFCRGNNFMYMETSAKTAANVADAFNELIEAVYTYRLRPPGLGTPSDRKPSYSSSGSRLILAAPSGGATQAARTTSSSSAPPSVPLSPLVRLDGTSPAKPPPSKCSC